MDGASGEAIDADPAATGASPNEFGSPTYALLACATTVRLAPYRLD
jgi:hypothetical protein